MGTDVLFRNGCSTIRNERLLVPGTVVVSLHHGSVINNVHLYAERIIARLGSHMFGELYAFTDMGMEGGCACALIDDDGELHPPAKGDHLFVYQG